MNLETRKINIINWVSAIQDEALLAAVEKIQMEKKDWWDAIEGEDKEAIKEGIKQLDNGEFLTRSQVRNQIKDKYQF